jgi:RimJ/RimL family protein N-acetyltransferase
MAYLQSIPISKLKVRTERVDLRWADCFELDSLAQRSVGRILEPAQANFCLKGDWTQLPEPDFQLNFLKMHLAYITDWQIANWTLPLTVFHKNIPVGGVYLHAENFLERKTIGFTNWILPGMRRRGLGHEISLAVLALSFDKLKAEKVTCFVHENNLAMIKVNQKIGFHQSGAASDQLFKDFIRFGFENSQWSGAEQIKIKGFKTAASMFGFSDIDSKNTV